MKNISDLKKSALAIAMVLVLGITVPAMGTDQALDNTMLTPNQGYNAYLATRDSWFLGAAAYLGDPISWSPANTGIRTNFYDSGPWRIYFSDSGIANHQDWPYADFIANTKVWHSRIHAANKRDVADAYVFQCDKAIIDFVVDGIKQRSLDMYGQRRLISFGYQTYMLLITDSPYILETLSRTITVVSNN